MNSSYSNFGVQSSIWELCSITVFKYYRSSLQLLFFSLPSSAGVSTPECVWTRVLLKNSKHLQDPA